LDYSPTASPGREIGAYAYSSGVKSRALGASVLAGALLIGGCAAPQPSTVSQPPGTPEATPTPTPTPTPPPFTPTPNPMPVPAIPKSPLTGLPQPTPQPVLIVKLDNTGNAQPHAGLHQADVVYIQEVEYGMTRIAAVFASQIPAKIGPVRSARITDIDLLRQYRKPAFAFSGAQRKLWPAINAAPWFDISPRTGASGYIRDRSRRSPYNYFLDGRIGLERAPKASVDASIGFAFDEEIPEGGTPVKSVAMRWPGSSAEFVYRKSTGNFDVSLNGRRAQAAEHDDGQQAATVIVQSVKQKPSIYFDKSGGNTPQAQTIGEGTALVFRDGQQWETTWRRERGKDGTQFRTADGKLLPFKPGQQWIVLLDESRSVTVTVTKPKKSPAPQPEVTPASEQ
jgi:hypothetical protein